MSAWAIIVDGEIDIRTVSPTDIGAMVNWLVVAFGAVACGRVSDDDVRSAFATMRGQTNTSVEVCPVEVRRALQ